MHFKNNCKIWKDKNAFRSNAKRVWWEVLQVKKFEQVQEDGGHGKWTNLISSMGSGHMRTSRVDRQTDTTENITFLKTT